MSELIYREIIDEKEGYIESIEKKNKVVLTGRKPFQNSIFVDELAVEVTKINGDEKLVVKVPYSGYYFELFLGDFNNDGLDEIFIRGSKGRTAGLAIGVVYALVDGELKYIFNQDKFNEEYEYTGKYLNYYKVLIKSENFNKSFILDISLKAKAYLDILYDKDGILKQQKAVTVSDLRSIDTIQPIYSKNNNLVAVQIINGISDVDNLGTVQSIGNLINNKFNITNLGVITYGGTSNFFRYNRTKNEKILEVLPNGAIIISLDKFGGVNDVIEYDFDGDGEKEVLVGYLLDGDPYIAVLKATDEKMNILDAYKGEGYNIEDIYISSNKNNDILVGWNVGSKYNKLDFLKLVDGKLKKDNKNKLPAYGILYLEDINNNGLNEIVLWIHDTDEAYIVRIYELKGKEFKETTEYDAIYFQKVKRYYERLLEENGEFSTYLYYLVLAQEKTVDYECALKTIDRALNTKYPYPSVKALNLLKDRILDKFKRRNKRIKKY